jgi:prepilin-type N-terminal cleavage/methylation domain-containing protein
MAIVPVQQKQKNYRGFTLIELMVTITIVVLVTGIVLVQYSSFNSSVLLTSQAYQLAFDLREAQSLAISVRGQY